mgnify:CR=1 FL=1
MAIEETLEKDFIKVMNQIDGNLFEDATPGDEGLNITLDSPIFKLPQMRDIDHIDAIDKVNSEIMGLNNDQLDEWTDTFLKVGKDYFLPEIHEEVTLTLESRLGMSTEDWLTMKHQSQERSVM